jgi:hypothetical protein
MQNATQKMLYIGNFLPNTEHKYYFFMFSSVYNSVSATSLLFCYFLFMFERLPSTKVITNLATINL